MAAATNYEADVENPPERDASNDPGEAELRRTMSKLDICDCLLWLRKLHAARVFDLLFALNVFTDSSLVSGHELQGLVMDVWWSLTSGERVTLPGTSLAHRLFDGINETIGLLHAMWLLTGPHFEDASVVRVQEGGQLHYGHGARASDLADAERGIGILPIHGGLAFRKSWHVGRPHESMVAPCVTHWRLGPCVGQHGEGRGRQDRLVAEEV